MSQSRHIRMHDLARSRGICHRHHAVEILAQNFTTGIVFGYLLCASRDRRESQPFLAINCAAIPDTLLESELFGYEKGAFTDARVAKKGILELASSGTVIRCCARRRCAVRGFPPTRNGRVGACRSWLRGSPATSPDLW